MGECRRKLFRSSMLLFISGIPFLTILFLNCSLSPEGNLAFFVELKDYAAGPETEVELRLDHSSSEKALEQTVRFDNSDSGSAVFSGTFRGIWTVTVSVFEGENILGERQFTVESVPGDTVTSRITAEYTGDSFDFSITSSSSQFEPSIEVTEFETFITAGRRIGMTNLDVGTRSIAYGSFHTASWVQLTYPEGLNVTAGSKSSFDEVHFNVHDASVDFFRPGYVETGDYSLILEDTKGTALTSYDSIDFLSDPTFTPEITAPPNDDDPLSDGSPVDWISGNAPEVVTVGIILYDETQPEVLVHTEVSYSPQTTSQFIIPGGSIDPLEWYRVIIFTTDAMVTEKEIRNFESYRAIDLPYQAAKHVDETITIFAYYERRADGT